MRNFNYYEDKAKKELMSTVKEAFEVANKDSVKLAVDFTVRSVAELDKPSSQHALRRIYKRMGRVAFEKAKKPELWMIMPVKGAVMNKIPLDEGIVIPVYAPRIFENKDLKEQNMLMGLFLILQQEFDEYYVKLLRSFEIDKNIAVPDLLEMLESDKYWKKRNIWKKK